MSIGQRHAVLICKKKRVKLDLLVWMIEHNDYEAKRLGVARQVICENIFSTELVKSEVVVSRLYYFV